MPRRMPDSEPWGQWPARLHAVCGPLAAAAWAAVRRRMGPRDEPAEIGLADLAEVLGRSTRTVKETLRRLAVAGWLRTRRTGRANLLAAVVPETDASAAEHIERGEKLPIRGEVSRPSEGKFSAHQRGENSPIGRPPPNNPPVVVEKQGEGGERTAPPPPATAETENGTTATATSAPPGGQAAAVPETGLLPEIAQFLARQVPREPADQVMAEISRDLALGRYTPEDLREYVAALPRISARSWRLREELPALLASRRAMERRRRLEAMRAWIGRRGWLAKDPSSAGRIVAVDADAGRVTILWAPSTTIEVRLPGLVKPARPVPARTQTLAADEVLRDWRLEDEAMPLLAQDPARDAAQAQRKGA